MSVQDDTARYCSELIAGIADAGITRFLISPGSRNTPLTLAALADPRIEDISVRDERSAGFIALGFAKSTGIAAAVICTSGSAAAHYLPSIVEANQSSAPLLVLTADRPHRLRGTGAPQTMDQVHLFGSHVKTFMDLEPSDAEPGVDPRAIGLALAGVAMESPAGPVHANVALEEPLIPDTAQRATEREAPPMPQSGYPHEGNILADLAARDVLIVAGGRQRPEFADLLASVSERLAAPIFADPQIAISSGNLISHHDLILGTSNHGHFIADDGPIPDVVLRLGPLPVSKHLSQWLETADVEQILVDGSRLTDPLASASTRITADPTEFLSHDHHDIPMATSSGFLEELKNLERRARYATDEAITDLQFPNEPEIARSLSIGAPSDSILYLASSMPIRDVGMFGGGRSDISVFANRGVNGIDGTISSAIGAAMSGRPVTLLVGDVAALHDATALAEAARLGLPLRIVVVNNNGGGIFSFLPVAQSSVIDGDAYERHWGTPHNLSLAEIARSMGMAATNVDGLEEYRAAISAPILVPELIELVTDRERNVEDHNEIRISVAQALARGQSTRSRPESPEVV